VVAALARLHLWKPIPIAAVRNRVADALAGDSDREIGLTFYNSAIRRLLGTTGVDQGSEFLDQEPPRWDGESIGRRREVAGPRGLERALDEALASLGLTHLADRATGAARIAAELRRRRPDLAGCDGGGATLEWIPTPFVRNRRAFLVARLDTARETGPVLVSIEHGPEGLSPRALVTEVDDASIVFGFTRSYFQVEVDRPRAVVSFLRSLLPTKRIDELYTVIGYHRHGKREFYQELQRSLADPGARFEPVEGVPGLVMICFAFRPMNTVFKVIRDRPIPPKQSSRREVKAKYQFVFLAEHGGRLADTQEFAGMALPRRAMAEPVAEELRAEARETVRESGDLLVFEHLFTERRMTPLDVFLRSADEPAARAAVLDFGRAIKDLAGLNIFPGDMLAKNFGVTRHGRVVFYDYDEICPLTDCTFRSIPLAPSYEDEVAAEPWYSVRESDVFPEELERFVRFPPSLHRVFMERHGDLFSPRYWSEVRERVSAGIVTEPPPYGPEHLLPEDGNRPA
jgi:isocitrate dehydrogenase kinase/phosphatase